MRTCLLILCCFANQIFGQMGSIIGDFGDYYTYTIGGNKANPDVTKKILNLNAGYSNNQTHIATTNQGNVLFYAADTSIYTYNRISVAPSKKLFFSNGVTGITTSALFQFSDRKFILFGMDKYLRNGDELRYTNIDASNHKNIRIISSNNLLLKISENDSINLICQLTSARINDSTYLLVAVTYQGDAYFYHVKWNKIKLVNKYNLINNIPLFDPSIYNKPNRSSKKIIAEIKISNKANKLVCYTQEFVNDRVPIFANFYAEQTVLEGHRMIIYNLDSQNYSILDSLTLVKLNPLKILRQAAFGNFTYSPNDSFLYCIQYNYPKYGNMVFNQIPIFKSNSSSNKTMLCQSENWNSALYSGSFLTHTGGIMLFETDSTNSHFLYWANSDNKYNGKDLFKSASKPKDYYGILFPTPFVYNYIKIRPEPFNGCESKYIFKNRSNQGRRFNRFIYYFAKDTAGQLWDTVTSFEPVYTYKTAGKFAYKCLGLTADGYSEWFEDSVTILNIPTPEITAIVAPSLQLVTMLDNRQVQVEWKPLKGANKYSIFKDGTVFRQTTDTIFIDELSTDVSRPIQYQIQAEDLCGNSSSLSNVGRTIFLKVEVIPSTNWSTAQSTRLTWNPYEFWNEGVLNYEIESNQESSSANWTLIERLNDTITNDNSFIEQGKYSKCYRISAVRAVTNNKSNSNVVCASSDPLIFIPSAFTPNDNGMNDEFVIAAIGFEKFSMDIYNSWGQKIHSQQNLTDNWKPTKDVPAGIYVYSIKGISGNGAEYQFSGTIQILR
jgi:CHU_C Type IX secretion signal domain